MKSAYSTLPEGFVEAYSVDLQKNKRQMLTVNGLAIVIMLAMLIPALVLNPIRIDFSESGALGNLSLNCLIAALGTVVYIVLHELTHGVFMRAFSKERVKYGFTGMYAYAGSEAYFPVPQYIIIALAPVVIWGVALLLLNLFLPLSVFWGVYFIQLENISGAAGDFYVTVRFLREKRDVLIQDSGVSMRVFAKKD